MFTTWGYKIRMSKAFAIGTADGDRDVGNWQDVGVLDGFVGATRLAAQPKGQKNNPPAIARCKSISSRPFVGKCDSICQIETIRDSFKICEDFFGSCGGCASCL